MSVRPSVRPSAVEHSCPVHNFDTVRDNFTKLGRNVKHDQTTCRDKQPSLHLHFLRNYSPLKFSVQKSCPLYNFDTVRDNFTKLGRNIKHYQTTCRDQNRHSTYIFCGIIPLCNFQYRNRVRSTTLIPI